jgi:formiminotetrahydrofolate cyclodeaminase
MKLTELTVKDLLAAFRSADPTPGGGSAAALAGAIGSSLLAMVAGLPKSRAATEADHARLRDARQRCAALSAELEALVDRDSDAYDLVMAAYRKPKGTDDEKVARSTAIQTAMREAIEAPLAVMRACAAAAGQGVDVAALGNPSASSDLLVGFEVLRAGLSGAQRNVETNLGSVKDANYAASVRREAEGFEHTLARETAAAGARLAGPTA